MVAHVFGEIYFLRCAVSLDFHQPGACSVIRRDKNAVAADDRGRGVGDVVSRALIFPQKFSILQIESDGALVSEENNLGRVTNLHRYRGGIAGAIALALPD